MIPLKIHKRIWALLSVYPQRDASKWNKFACMAFLMFIFLSELSCFATSFAFVITFASTDLESSLHALFQCSIYACVSYYTVNAFLSRRQICRIFDELTEFYEKCTTNTFN